MRRGFIRTGSVTFVAAALLCSAPTSRFAAADDARVFARIREAWTERQSRFRSGVIRWTQLEFYKQGRFRQGQSKRIVHSVNCEFAFDGERSSYTSEGQEWYAEKQRFQHRIFRATVNGPDVQMLFDAQRRRYPAGFLCARTVMTEGTDQNREAAIVSFRPLAANLSWYANLEQGWTVAARKELVQGSLCIRLQADDPGSPWTVWLDPQRDYLPLRRAYFYENRLHYRLDIEYRQDPEFGWIPDTWSWSEFEPKTGRIYEGFTASVTDATFNRPVPLEELEMQFRPGTQLRNERNGEYGIIREDGSFRLIDDAELAMGKGYEELLRTEAPSVLRRRKSLWFWWAGGSGVLVLLLGLYWWKRRGGFTS